MHPTVCVEDRDFCRRLLKSCRSVALFGQGETGGVEMPGMGEAITSERSKWSYLY